MKTDLPDGVHRKLKKISKELPRGTKLRCGFIIGSEPIVMDGKVHLRVVTKTGNHEWRTVSYCRSNKEADDGE